MQHEVTLGERSPHVKTVCQTVFTSPPALLNHKERMERCPKPLAYMGARGCLAPLSAAGGINARCGSRQSASFFKKLDQNFKFHKRSMIQNA